MRFLWENLSSSRISINKTGLRPDQGSRISGGSVIYRMEKKNLSLGVASGECGSQLSEWAQ